MGNASSALSNAIRLGTVAEVNLATARCRVQVGEMLTDYLPWVVTLAGTTIIWSAPSIGEQVVVLSPAGDLADGLVLRGLYSDHLQRLLRPTRYTYRGLPMARRSITTPRRMRCRPRCPAAVPRPLLPMAASRSMAR